MNKQFSASQEYLYEMREFIGKNIAASELSRSDITKIELAVEEALTNILNYSGLGKDDTIDISICLTNGIKIVIKDQGVPFNPLCHSRKMFDPVTPLEHRELGGFGIFLILHLMDKVEYHRENNYNVLTLFKGYK